MTVPKKACPECGKTVKPTPSGIGRPRVFCSQRCRWDAHHRRYIARRAARNAS